MAERTVAQVAALMRDAAMSASYKPALLKALANIFVTEPMQLVPLSRIGNEFARMYWNQTILYHLRQSSDPKKESEVIKRIKEISESTKTRHYGDLSTENRAMLSKRMSEVLRINVLEAFHASAPAGMAPLYRWDGGSGVLVEPDAAAFLAAESAGLTTIGNYYWAKFLESRNRLAPHLIQKVEANGLPRVSLKRFLAILLADDLNASCFYCGTQAGDAGTHVDHVIPRSFIMEDPLWDLVVSCARCNIAKSDYLPEPVFLEKLIQRNAAVARRSLKGANMSPFSGYEDVQRLYEAALSLDWPHYWAPS